MEEFDSIMAEEEDVKCRNEHCSSTITNSPPLRPLPQPLELPPSSSSSIIPLKIFTTFECEMPPPLHAPTHLKSLQSWLQKPSSLSLPTTDTADPSTIKELTVLDHPSLFDEWKNEAKNNRPKNRQVLAEFKQKIANSSSSSSPSVDETESATTAKRRKVNTIPLPK